MITFINLCVQFKRLSGFYKAISMKNLDSFHPLDSSSKLQKSAITGYALGISLKP